MVIPDVFSGRRWSKGGRGVMRKLITITLYFVLMKSRVGGWPISRPLWWLYDRLRPGFEFRRILRLVGRLAADETETIAVRRGRLSSIRTVIAMRLRDLDHEEPEKAQ